MKEETVSRIAMVILAVVMAAFGLFHIMKPSSLIGFVPSFLPGGKVWVYVVGVAFMLVALALLAHRQVKLAGYLLAIMLLVFILTIHLPNYLNSGDPEQRQQAFVNLLKDSAIAAFALYIASNARKIE